MSKVAENNLVQLITTTFCCVLFLVIVALLSRSSGYREGQIDAMNGIYKYEMKVNQDTTYIYKDE